MRHNLITTIVIVEIMFIDSLYIKALVQQLKKAPLYICGCANVAQLCEQHNLCVGSRKSIE